MSYTQDLTSSRELNGVYCCIVEDNKDPLQIGRVKLRIPLVHGLEGDGISKDSLPWSHVLQQSSGYHYGSFMIPEIGERGMAVFEDNDVNKPVWIGAIFSTKTTQSRTYQTEESVSAVGKPGENEVPEDAVRASPNLKMIYQSTAGIKVFVDNKTGQENLTIQDKNGQRFFVDQVNNQIRMDGTGAVVFIKGAELWAGEQKSGQTGFYYNVSSGFLKITNGKASITFGKRGSGGLLKSSGRALLAASNDDEPAIGEGGYVMNVENVIMVCRQAALSTGNLAIRAGNINLSAGNLTIHCGKVSIYSDRVNWFVSRRKGFRVYD